MAFLNLLLYVIISSGYYNIKGRCFNLLQRIIIISNLFNYSLLKGLFIKAANKIIYKALRDSMLPVKYFKNYYLPLLYKFNYALLIITIAFPLFYKVLGGKKSSRGNIKLATRYNMLIAIFIFPKQLLTSAVLKLISVLVNKAYIPL